MPKEQLATTIRQLLRDVMKARFEGGAYSKLARANGYADGYMRALMDAGIVEHKELLQIVSDERNASEFEGASLASQTI